MASVLALNPLDEVTDCLNECEQVFVYQKARLTAANQQWSVAMSHLSSGDPYFLQVPIPDSAGH